MQPDFDDTVIGPLRRLESALPDEDGDTFVRARPRFAPDAGALPSTTEAQEPGYRFVVNSYEPIDLDRPAYIGRRPSPPRILRGERPRLIRVPSVLGEVSGTHLELRQQGSAVIATDLRSTNGTLVRIPGSQPTRLRQGESVVVTPGSVIEIGDGNVIEILSAERVRASARPEYGQPLGDTLS